MITLEDYFMKEKKFSRECPICKKQIFYSTKKYRNRAAKLGRSCYNCSAKERANRPEVKEKMSKIFKVLYSGSGNPFFGRHHTEESKRKIVDSNRKSYHKWVNKEFKEKMSKVTSGKNNAMYGKNVYDIWVEKYGQEKANEKMSNFRKKQSASSSGKNNPMYGKPSPQGSGNGWSGWYKGWYFRSLKELSYMISVIEKNGWTWRSAETKDLSIKYIDYKGDDRTYRADFLINDFMLVEIKPKKLMESPSNKIKKDAAIKFCREKGYRYFLVDIKLLDIDKLIELYTSGMIRFISKYKTKMENIICKQIYQK